MTDQGGSAEEEGGSSTRAFLLAIVALYLFFGLLYLLQRPIARATGRCFGRRRASMDSHGASITRSPSIYVLIWRKGIFAIRTQIFHRMHRTCNGGPSDESNYQSWTASQVSSWAYAKLQSQYREGRYGWPQLSGGYEDGEDAYEQQLAIQTAVVVLQRQHIDGNALVHLTLDRLIRFGIPFGVAVRLMACIQELVPHRLASGSKADALLPAWYERKEAVNDNCEVQLGEKELEMAAQAQNVMKERFGMTLPALRGGEASGDASNGNDPRSGASHPTSLPTGQQAALDDVISSMPPEVRAVAERRPDLVAQLMSQSQNHRSPAALQTAVSEQTDYQSDEENGVDPESVGLLRRRANR